ncbi:MAG: HEAT repeat domain-containing protein [Planctomycetota bacterium]|jgi:HEAT repeat protein
MKALAWILILACAAAAQDLKAAQKTIRSRKASDAALIAALDILVEAERKLTPDDKKTRKLITQSVLRLMQTKREPVQWETARALGRLHPSNFRLVARAITRGLLAQDEVSVRIWEAVCSSLLRLDLEQGTVFLIEEVIDPNTDEPRWRRTRAAIMALAASPRPSAKTRHEAVKDLLARFQSFPFHVEEDADWVAGFRNVKRSFKRSLARHGLYWADMRARVQRVLLRYCADPLSGALPRDVDTGAQVEILERLKVWNGRHKNRKQPPWVDPKAPLPRTAYREIREPGRALYLRFAAPWTVYWPMLAPPMPKDKLEKERKALRENVLPPVMRTGMSDSDWRVRGMAAIGLGRIGGGDKELWGALDREKDERVREAIAYALLLTPNKELVNGWRDRADDVGENPQVRALALLALGCLGDIEFLRKRKDTHPELLGCTIAAIGIAGAKADSHRLTGILLAKTCPPGVRGAAAAAMVRVGDPADTGPLLDALRRTKDPLRQAALAHALAGTVRSDDTKQIRSLARLFLQPKGTYGGHRVEAALALARIGGPDAAAMLREGAKMCSKNTKRAAEYGTMLFALATCEPQLLAGHFDEAKAEWDAAAAALAMAQAGVRTHTAVIRTRMKDASRIYIPSAIEALGRLDDAASLAVIEKQLVESPRDRVIASGAVALARLRGAKAQLLPVWKRAEDRAEFAGLAVAFGIAGPGGEEKELLRIANEGRAMERAFALCALAAMATPSQAIARRVQDAFFAYDAPRTVTRLSRFGNSFFLAQTDE